MNFDPQDVKVKDYFKIHDYYTEKFGENTILLMQVGSFHECYGTDKDGADVPLLSSQLEISHTKKSKSKPLSKTNPRMIGFPIYSTGNWIDKLVKLNYNVVVFDQTTEPPNPKRGLREIYSPGIYFEKEKYNINSNTNITFLYIENTDKFIVSISSYDIVTGKGMVYEDVGTDDYKVLDELFNFNKLNPPQQCLVCLEGNSTFKKLDFNELMNYIGIQNYKKIKSHIKSRPEMKKILSSTYNLELNNEVFDELDIAYYHYIPFSLCSLLEYINVHHPLLTKKLEKPKIFTQKNKLYFGNNPLEQLDVDTKNKYSLINIIDNTATTMGKRYLKNQIAEPSCKKSIIDKRYTDIAVLLPSCENINKLMKDYCDLSKQLKKIQILKILPNEFYLFVDTISMIKNINTKTINKVVNIEENMEDLNKLIENIENTFYVEKLKNVNFYNYVEEINALIKNEEIESLETKIQNSSKYMEILAEKLSSFIKEKRNTGKVVIKKNTRDGMYLITTQRRVNMIKMGLEEIKKINVLDLVIETKNIEFIPVSKKSDCDIKIITPQINEISENIGKYKEKLAKLTKQLFYEKIAELECFYDVIKDIIKKISYLDFINSGAITAKKNGYCKPTIKKSSTSYFRAIKLRHPIVEQINNEVEYSPHSIELGGKTGDTGIVLYGINGSGKSTLMKSIGLNIIMAQIGYYVAAKSFTYSPYKSIFTRIRGNDNLFKKLSSFYVEMLELKAIIKRNNKNTLVLADEICRGTEEKSANIIVAYMIESLVRNNASFITATHLHSLVELPVVKNLENIAIKHISVDYDEETKNIVFSRHLLDGAGSKFYGLDVAKFLMENEEFNIKTSEIRKEYENSIENIRHTQTNKYNVNVEMNSCYYCKKKKNLEVHHINWQKDCDKYKVVDKPHIKKNTKNNLIVLCMECHDKVDRGEIIIKGWVDTIKGRKLR